MFSFFICFQVVHISYWMAFQMLATSSNVHMWSASPSTIAGVLFILFRFPWLTSIHNDLCGFTKLYNSCRKSVALECIFISFLQFMPFRMNLCKSVAKRIKPLSMWFVDFTAIASSSSVPPKTICWTTSTTLLFFHFCIPEHTSDLSTCTLVRLNSWKKKSVTS